MAESTEDRIRNEIEGHDGPPDLEPETVNDMAAAMYHTVRYRMAERDGESKLPPWDDLGREDKGILFHGIGSAMRVLEAHGYELVKAARH